MAQARALGALLLATAACAGGVVAVARLALTGLGGRLDTRALEGFEALEDPTQQDEALAFFTRLTDPTTFVLLLVALVLYGVASGRSGRVVAAVAVALGATLSAQALKRPPLVDLHGAAVQASGPGSFPSGHGTAALALGLGLVLVAPDARRPLAVAGAAAFTLAQGVTMLANDWHLPSDVLGGYLVTGVWGCGAAALVLAAADRAAPVGLGVPALARPGRAVLRVTGLAVALAALVAMVWAGPRPVVAWVGGEGPGVLALGLLVALAVGLPALVGASLPGRVPRVR